MVSATGNALINTLEMPLAVAWTLHIGSHDAQVSGRDDRQQIVATRGELDAGGPAPPVGHCEPTSRASVFDGRHTRPSLPVQLLDPAQIHKSTQNEIGALGNAGLGQDRHLVAEGGYRSSRR
jgi:hypothetical protein